ncbi:hypothetical protein FOB41_16525 [Agrobacterium pusense]|uniref:Uncharacterized protein n=1 Tax=Agrobacterium pusense TaxID=648995 RepID=A0A6H0ZRZ5_9HYPH|nr:hypothetical protein [Agrobacterium pusense]QIX22631.1 hypothetical protein FOB41_16525 [Agrobacterium pusense]
MHAAIINVEHFPTWQIRAIAQSAPGIDWLQVGLEHDIRKMIDLCQRHLFRQVTTQCDLLALPDDNGVMWQLYRRLVADELRQELVRVRDGYVSIDKRHLGDLREGFALLAEFLEADHPPHLHVWDEDAWDYVRRVDAPPPVVDRREARALYAQIDRINGLATDNVIILRGEA